MHKSLILKKSLTRLAVLFFVFALPFSVYSQASANQPVFNHAALCAKNLKKTANFYSTVLQLQKIQNPFNDTTHVWFKIGEGLALHVIQGNCPSTVQPIAIHLCFKVPSLEAFIRHLDDLNVSYQSFAGEPKKIQLRPDGVRQIYFQDPDGFWIEVNDAK
jgi:lactoylglutathione lyase